MAFLMPLINWLFGGALQNLLGAWLNYKSKSDATSEAAFAEVVKAEIQIDAMKVQVYGTLSYRIITLLVGIPVAIHFSLVFVDTILSSQFLYGRPILGVPNPPGQYPTFEWAIIASFFLVHTATRWAK